MKLNLYFWRFRRERKVPKVGLTEQDFQDAANQLGVDVPAIKAVAEVESGRHGAFLRSGEPVILFERHKFHKFTNGKFSTPANRNISWPVPSKKGTGAINEYGAPSDQHARLAKAATLDRDAALQSASWGRFQVMGFNWRPLGYASLQDFINAMYRSEADHLDAFLRYVKVNGLIDELRNHKWAAFARGYNGADYKINRYDTKLAEAYRRHGGK